MSQLGCGLPKVRQERSWRSRKLILRGESDARAMACYGTADGGAHVILIGLFARCNLSQALRAEPPPRLLSRIFPHLPPDNTSSNDVHRNE